MKKFFARLRHKRRMKSLKRKYKSGYTVHFFPWKGKYNDIY